jgi:predicted secreted protein
MLRWVFMVLAHCNNNLQVDMSLHADILSWFWANQSLLLPLMLRVYIVWWYKTLYQVLPIATRSDTGSHNRLNLIQSLVPPHYVRNRYISWQSVLLVEDTRVLWENHRPDVCRSFCVWRHVIFSVHSPMSGYCVLSHIPMVWHHVKVVRQRMSRATSHHSLPNYFDMMSDFC